ncbi:MAG: sigma-70 family RNA polymerase sigma factor [Rhodospirillales bacterium]|nr:sigma-70 family RNA polymerase sigma factor [Rhodospirillales bacterium]
MPVSHDIIIQTLMRHRAKLLGYVIVILGDEHAAEDVFQEISLAAVRKSDEIRDTDHLLAWLRQAARYKAMEIRRNQATRATLISSEVIDALESHWQDLDRENNDQLTALRRCMKKLTPRAQELLAMRYVKGWASGRIAEHLQQKAETVYKALSRAHVALSDCVHRVLAEETGGRS